MSLRLEPLEQRVLLSGGAEVMAINFPAMQVGYWQSGNAKVWAYDTSGPVDIDANAIQVKFGTNDAVSSITLTGAQTMEGLGIVVSGSSLGSIKDSRTGAKGDLAFVVAYAPVKSIQIRGNISGFHLNGAALGIGTLSDDIDSDGDTGDATAFLIAPAQSVKLDGAVIGDAIIMGQTGTVSLKAFSTKSGGMDGDLVADAEVGKVVLGGTYAGEMRIGGSLSGLQITGGNLAGSVLVQGVAGKLSVAGMKNKQTGLTTGGDMTTGAHIYAGVALTSLSVSGNIVGVSAAENDLVQICAPVIGSISVNSARGGMTYARILAGANLGADWALGGSGDDADSFAAGTIGKISVKADVFDCLIGAGVQSHNGVIDLQWLHDNTAFIAGSTIKSGTIGGDLISSWGGVGAPYGVGAATLGKGKIGGTGEDLVFSNEDLITP
jgi:hypothetical protein